MTEKARFDIAHDNLVGAPSCRIGFRVNGTPWMCLAFPVCRPSRRRRKYVNADETRNNIRKPMLLSLKGIQPTFMPKSAPATVAGEDMTVTEVKKVIQFLLLQLTKGSPACGYRLSGFYITVGQRIEEGNDVPDFLPAECRFVTGAPIEWRINRVDIFPDL